MMERTGRRSVPLIFIGDTHVGGCDDLYELDHQGNARHYQDNLIITATPAT